ncbi:MAG: hypothetical protein AAFQ21_02265 [Pseudomonadota bacterium]
MRDWIIITLAAALAVGGYLAVGSPMRADMPMSARQAELAAMDPLDMSPAETLARLERLTQDQPDDPQPHYFIGELLKSQGRDGDAVRAYQSALRRNSEFAPALLGLADAIVRLQSGDIPDQAAQLYSRAYSLDRQLVRAGFMAGLAAWRAGESERARDIWSAVQNSLEPNDPRRTQLDGWVRSATAE